MLGRVNYITQNIYQDLGPYDKVDGTDFEDEMQNLISNHLHNYFHQGLRLKKTSRLKIGRASCRERV